MGIEAGAGWVLGYHTHSGDLFLQKFLHQLRCRYFATIVCPFGQAYWKSYFACKVPHPVNEAWRLPHSWDIPTSPRLFGIVFLPAFIHVVICCYAQPRPLRTRNRERVRPDLLQPR